MNRAIAGNWPIMRVVLALLVLILSVVVSYGVTTAVLNKTPIGGPEPKGRPATPSVPFANGEYLTAYVFVASECGICAEKQTKLAIRQLRDSLYANHHDYFASISVVGIALDKDLDEGIDYLRHLGPTNRVFDELSVGNSWMNEFVASFVWRQGVGRPAVPQVIVTGRRVDVTNYPRYIDVQPDSVLRHIGGRDSLIQWVANGTPLK